jgi:cell division protease FtsH
MAATNRIDVLDPALLRPGRFDRRVTVGRPDVRGRHQILKVHTRKTPLHTDIDLEIIAKGTPGFTGADLANLVNEAALLAARDSKKSLSMHDFESAKDKVLMGVARKSMMISEKEKRLTAYHEAGHTLVGMNLPYTDPIHKVSIIPRGQALGVTQTLPNEDMLNLSKEKGENFISFLMGGRVAEEIVYGEMTNGASNDIERATDLARSMVCHWGMSERLGPINYAKGGNGPMYDNSVSFSDETSRKIDSEISLFVQKNYEVAKNILQQNIDALHRVALALVVWETLDAEQIKDIVAGKDIGAPVMNKKPTDIPPSGTVVGAGPLFGTGKPSPA